jgi:hypothetical protein
LLEKIGFAIDGDSAADVAEQEEANSIVFLGCFREASSILHEMELQSKGVNGESSLLYECDDPTVCQSEVIT